MVLFNSLLNGIQQLLQEVLFDEKAPQLSFQRCCKQHPKWGSRDRKLVGKVLYDTLRWKRLYCWCLNTETLDKNQLLELIWVWSQLENITWKHPPSENFVSKEVLLSRFSEAKNFPAITNSIPQWLETIGRQTFEADWDKECVALNQPAPVVIRVNTLKSTRKNLQKLLTEQGVQTTALANYPDALQCEGTPKLTTTDLYQKGYFEIQDANSQKVAQWMAPQKNSVLFDVCAGAGGKSLHLATLLEGTGKVVAMDAIAKKLEVLKERSTRNGLKNIQIQTEVDGAFQSQWGEKVDGVLIDSPCSGLGVLRRHPEHKWIMTPERIEALNTVQQNLLQTHCQWVKPGGFLFYATCSILPSENDLQIEQFLKSEKGKSFNCIAKETLLTHTTGHDGFFIAKLQRLE